MMQEFELFIFDLWFQVIASHLHIIYLFRTMILLVCFYLVEYWFVFISMHLNLWFVIVMDYDSLLIVCISL
jgi:hypothetical protein